MVFSKGTFKGLNLVIDTGGQICPNSTLGLKEKWKKLQKNEEKNITSDVIKRIIPSFKPLITSSKWYPWNVASRVTSFHHRKAIVASIKFTNTKKKLKLKNKFQLRLKAKKAAIKEQTRGQGLLVTIW